jgi:tetratricopeptide (TPR) repeat protein
MLRYFLSDTIKALEDIRNAINFEPKNPFYHYALAYILIDKGELETVVNECNEALKYDKTFVDVLVMKGSALDQLKKSFEARKNYIKALQIDSTYEDIYIIETVPYFRRWFEIQGQTIYEPKKIYGGYCRSRFINKK